MQVKAWVVETFLLMISWRKVANIINVSWQGEQRGYEVEVRSGKGLRGSEQVMRLGCIKVKYEVIADINQLQKKQVERLR